MGLRNGWMGRFKGMGGWVGIINIKDMFENDVGKGGVRGFEAYEVK